MITPLKLTLNDTERKKVYHETKDLLSRYQSIDNKEFRELLPYFFFRIFPEHIVRQIAAFKDNFYQDSFGAIVIHNLINLEDFDIGATPEKWQTAERTNSIKHIEFIKSLLHGGCASQLMQWIYQRGGGGFCHQVIPDANMTHTQTGASSEVDLSLHSEDTTLNCSADFVSFLWLRNNEKATSNLYSVRNTDWNSYDELRNRLFEDKYVVQLDDNYKKNRGLLLQKLSNKTFSVLYGNQKHPWLRVDFVEMIDKQLNEDANKAIKEFKEIVKDSIYTFTPKSGDAIIMNNKMCAHGRGKFIAGKFEDQDVDKRWMLRMMSVTDSLNAYKFCKGEKPNLIQEMYCGINFDEISDLIDEA